jgi:hypothetical protein
MQSTQKLIPIMSTDRNVSSINLAAKRNFTWTDNIIFDGGDTIQEIRRNLASLADTQQITMAQYQYLCGAHAQTEKALAIYDTQDEDCGLGVIATKDLVNGVLIYPGTWHFSKNGIPNSHDGFSLHTKDKNVFGYVDATHHKNFAVFLRCGLNEVDLQDFSFQSEQVRASVATNNFAMKIFLLPPEAGVPFVLVLKQIKPIKKGHPLLWDNSQTCFLDAGIAERLFSKDHGVLISTKTYQAEKISLGLILEDKTRFVTVERKHIFEKTEKIYTDQPDISLSISPEEMQAALERSRNGRYVFVSDFIWVNDQARLTQYYAAEIIIPPTQLDPIFVAPLQNNETLANLAISYAFIVPHERPNLQLFEIPFSSENCKSYCGKGYEKNKQGVSEWWLPDSANHWILLPNKTDFSCRKGFEKVYCYATDPNAYAGHCTRQWGDGTVLSKMGRPIDGATAVFRVIDPLHRSITDTYGPIVSIWIRPYREGLVPTPFFRDQSTYHKAYVDGCSTFFSLTKIQETLDIPATRDLLEALIKRHAQQRTGANSINVPSMHRAFAQKLLLFAREKQINNKQQLTGSVCRNATI